MKNTNKETHGADTHSAQAKSNKNQNLHPQKLGVRTRRAITISKSPGEVFAFWRDFTNLPLFMKDLQEVRVLSPTRSVWKVKSKTGIEAEWSAKITEEKTGQLIAWESEEGSLVKTSGEISFAEAPAGLGCIVELFMEYKIPGGKLTEIAAMLTGEDANNLVANNLKRLKGYLETGVIATVQGQSSGRDKDSHSLH